VKNKEYISASEIAEFVYCPMCWWKKVNGLSGENESMKRGNDHHNFVFRWQLMKRWLVFGVMGLFVIVMLVILLIVLLNHFNP